MKSKVITTIRWTNSYLHAFEESEVELHFMDMTAAKQILL